GVVQLAIACPQQPYVGVTLAQLALEIADLAAWIVEEGGDFTACVPLRMTMCALLRALAAPRATALTNAVLELGDRWGWDAAQTARFLVLAREERATWD